MSKKHKEVCKVWNYIVHSLIVNSTITECVSISDFASLGGVSIGVTSAAVGLKIYVILQEIKSISQGKKKKEKRLDKVVLLTKSKLNNIKVLISRALIDSDVNHDESIL